MVGLNGTIDIKSGKYRPCVINGVKALFHRWVDKDLIILKSDCVLHSDKIALLRKKYEETHVVPGGISVEKTKITLAIVEFEDGLVKEVEPESIKFLDSRNIFYEYALPYAEI